MKKIEDKKVIMKLIKNILFQEAQKTENILKISQILGIKILV